MELRQLRYFLALADHRHFGRAAESLHITQPSLSQQIKALETELGTILFDRSRRHVALTPEGAVLLSYARRIVDLVEDARAELADQKRLQQGHIRLGATPTLGGYLLPKLLWQFHQRFPGLDLTITEDGSDRLAQQLNEGLIDLALLVEGPKVENMAFEFLLQERIFVGLPPDHPLSKRKSIALAELKDDRFILCREGYHLRSLTLEACQSVGFSPRVTVSGTDVDTALRFVQAGLGVTLIPEFVASSVQGVATPVLENPALHRSIGIAWNPQRYLSQASSAMLRFLREACRAFATPGTE